MKQGRYREGVKPDFCFRLEEQSHLYIDVEKLISDINSLVKERKIPERYKLEVKEVTKLFLSKRKLIRLKSHLRNYATKHEELRSCRHKTSKQCKFLDKYGEKELIFEMLQRAKFFQVNIPNSLISLLLLKGLIPEAKIIMEYAKKKGMPFNEYIDKWVKRITSDMRVQL
jgi:hypothetical protein